MQKAQRYLRVTLALGILLAPEWVVPQQDIRLPKPKEKWIRVQYTLPVHNRVPSLAGYFLSRPDRNYIVINAEERASQIIYHEYIHFFVNNNLPDVPLWFNEGLAEYYSTFESNEDKTKLGVPVAHHIAFLKQHTTFSKPASLMSWDQLLEQDDILHEAETQIGSFYAQSWLLVHYLMQGDERRLRPRLSRYLMLLAQGCPQSQAFREAFEMEATQLQKELEHYLRRVLFNYTEIDSKDLAVVAPAQVAPLPYEEVLFYLGDLLAHHGKERVHEAAAHFNQAISANPNYALGYAGLGLVEMNRGSITEARRHFGKAIELDSPHPEIYYHYGNCLMDGITSRVQVDRHDPAVQKTLHDARSAFRTAIDLDNDFVEAYAALGETFIFDIASPLDEGITALKFALKRLPSRRDIALNLLFLCAQNGDSTIVEILLNRVFPPQGNSSLLAEAQLATTALERATQLFEQNKTREALRILDRVQSVTKDQHHLQQIGQMRQVARYNHYVHLYKNASIRAANKQFDEALELLNRIIATCDDAKLKESADHSAKRIQHNQQVGWYNQAVALMKNKQYNQAVQLLNRIVAAPGDPKLAKAAQDVLTRIRRIQKQRN